ncbi:MAG TPA: hypothetical protein VGX70_13405 [Gemmataceae bacterium]|jgi:hypothetical protein|nr:hypothetical protein [Gemmataceae bacterium]
MRDFDRVRHQFETWVISLSASKARNTSLGDKDEPIPYAEHVGSIQVVETFLKLHPGQEHHRTELMKYAKEARPNGVYVMKLGALA